jgi:glyoxylase-like metal-dependent hydrolase (beta-lactamase superfamily II)
MKAFDHTKILALTKYLMENGYHEGGRSGCMVLYRIVKEGYVIGKGAKYRASSTCVLIEDNGISVLVDPGSSPDVPRAVRGCDVIYLTHSHIDHYMNAGAIPHSSMMDRFYIFEGDQLTEHSGTIPGTRVRILPTPGHSLDHSSLLFDADGGPVLVAGDLFWWSTSQPTPGTREDLLSLPDPFADDLKKLKESRIRALEMAKILIPGHGRMLDIPSLL